MRLIKFRGQRIDTGTWVYGHYFTTPLTDENSGTKPDAGWFFLSGETRHCISQDGVAFVVKPETVGQFTGLKDKNGKEIYEDSSVKDKAGDEWLIRWSINDACWVFQNPEVESNYNTLTWLQDSKVLYIDKEGNADCEINY